MRSKVLRRPSPAMIVAMIALFVALTGGGYAAVTLSSNSVRSSTIVNGQVKTADLANGAVTNAKLKNSAVNSAKVKNGTLEVADLSGAALADLRSPSIMWGVVNANGTLARGTAGVTSQYSGASFYTVTFPRDVTQCVYEATIGGVSNVYPGHGEISTYSANLRPNAVTVVTHDSAGSFSDRSFHVVVTC